MVILMRKYRFTVLTDPKWTPSCAFMCFVHNDYAMDFLYIVKKRKGRNPKTNRPAPDNNSKSAPGRWSNLKITDAATTNALAIPNINLNFSDKALCIFTLK